MLASIQRWFRLPRAWGRPRKRWLKAFKLLSVSLLLGLVTALAAVGVGHVTKAKRHAALLALIEQNAASPGDAPHVSAALRLPRAPVNFTVQKAGFAEFAYPPETRERIQPLVEQAAAIRQELAARFGRPVLGQVHVHIARTVGEMATLAPAGAPFPSYASGVAYPQIGLVLLSIFPEQPSAQLDLVEVFRHELAHVALYDATAGAAVPRWINEGFAIHLSGESSLARVSLLWPAVLAGDVLPFSELDRAFASGSGHVNLAYAQAADVVRYLLRTRDTQRFTLLLDDMRDGQSFESALRESYGLDLTGLEYEWRDDASQRYSFWPVLLSGSMIWIGVLGLLALAWRSHRKRQQATLERWAREEAQEELLKKTQSRLHIVLAPSADKQNIPLPRVVEREVPKVEHEGDWHTLH